MLLGEHTKHSIRRKILYSLFTPPQNRLEARRKEVANQGYKIWISKYQSDINTLPKTFFTFTSTTKMAIEQDGHERFWHTSHRDSNTPQYITQVNSDSHLPDTTAFPAPSEVEDNVNAILADMAQLSKERKEMENYLHESLTAWNTTTKLRKNWPKALQQFIPPEPPRAPRKAKVAKPPETLNVATPQNIESRMTLNILENDT